MMKHKLMFAPTLEIYTLCFTDLKFECVIEFGVVAGLILAGATPPGGNGTIACYILPCHKKQLGILVVCAPPSCCRGSPAAMRRVVSCCREIRTWLCRYRLYSIP